RQPLVVIERLWDAAECNRPERNVRASTPERHRLYVGHAAQIADDAQITIQVRAPALWKERAQQIEPFLSGDDGRSRAAVGAKRRSLKRAEEEQLIFLDRPAEREAILILNRDRN